jgi:hypothetical protein
MGRNTVRSYRIVFKCRGGRANACSGAPCLVAPPGFYVEPVNIDNGSREPGGAKQAKRSG